jgi:hypothetical protein
MAAANHIFSLASFRKHSSQSAKGRACLRVWLECRQMPLTSPLIFAVLEVLSTVKEFTETAVPFFKPGTADDS